MFFGGELLPHFIFRENIVGVIAKPFNFKVLAVTSNNALKGVLYDKFTLF